MLKINNILLPVDFSDLSKHALPYAIDLAKKFGAKLHILHVFDENTLDPYYFGNTLNSQDFYKKVQEEFQERIEEYLHESGSDDVNIIPVLANGVPFVEIVHYAKNEKIDLIIITTHGRTGLSHMLLGSTAEKIIRKSSKPVFVVKHENFEFSMP